MRNRNALLSLGALVAALGGCGQDPRDHIGATHSSLIAETDGSALPPGCPPEWWSAVPPDPSWGLPATFGQTAPTQFYDFELRVIWFSVPLAGLKTLLPPSVNPMEFPPQSGSGMGLAGASFWNYEAVQYYRPYKESAVSVLVEDSSIYLGYLPLFVVEMAVDSEAAQWGGNQLGLNKIMGNTHCKNVRPQGIKCMSESDDELIMKATIDTSGATFPDALGPIMTLGVRDGLLTHTAVTYGQGSLTRTYVTPSFRFGEYPLAQKLADAGIGATPIFSAWGEHLSSTVGAWGYCTPL